MTTNADLAAWGEPPASTAENALASFLDTAMDLFVRGEPVQAERLLSATPNLLGHGERLFGDLKTLFWAAGSVWEYSGLLSPPSPKSSELGGFAEETLPDPFPNEFRVCRLLGTGSFGEVWLADDLNLGRPVALKTLRFPLKRDGENLPLLAALRNEARLLAALRHPNIVQVYAWRQGRDEDYLVLQYVGGGSLAGRVQREGPLSWRLAARYVADAAEGLLEVHARGIIHRDVKPANLLWDPEADEALLTDFGVSARLSPTGADGVAGTPSFMAPEAFLGRCTPALDVYSLAATLFWLITGERPFPASTTAALLEKIAQGLPDPDPRCTGLPASLEAVIRHGLAANPERRPGLNAFVSALRGSLNQLLADSLVSGRVVSSEWATDHSPLTTHHSPAVDLRLLISRQDPLSAQGAFVPVLATHPAPEQILRDLQRVPPSPRQVDLRTGDRVRIEVVADRPGFVTVFNVGPTGNLNLLYPAQCGDLPQPLPAGQALPIVDVGLTPPAGRERLFALWSRQRLALRLDELFSLAQQGQVPGSGPYRATRDMVRMQESVGRLAPADWHAVVLQLNHSPQPPIRSPERNEQDR